MATIARSTNGQRAKARKVPKRRPAAAQIGSEHGRPRRHTQGRMAIPRRCVAPPLARGRPAFPRPHHSPPRARSARRSNAARRGEDRAPRADDLPLHRPRPDLEGSEAAARVHEEGRRQRPQRRPHLLADARPRERARASGTRAPRRRACSAPTTAASPGARPRRSTTTRVHRVDGHRAGRHAGRAEDAFHHRRPARSGPPVLRACRAAACTSRPMAAGPSSC